MTVKNRFRVPIGRIIPASSSKDADTPFAAILNSASLQAWRRKFTAITSNPNATTPQFPTKRSMTTSTNYIKHILLVPLFDDRLMTTRFPIMYPRFPLGTGTALSTVEFERI